MKKPLLTTFVGSEETLLAAIEAGADHLILEDSKLAVRSYTDDFLIPGFEKIKTLTCLARYRMALIDLSVNVDEMIHDKDFALLDVL